MRGNQLAPLNSEKSVNKKLDLDTESLLKLPIPEDNDPQIQKSKL